MVLGCKICDGYIGMREPISDWSIDRSTICPACLKKQKDKSRSDAGNERAEKTPRPASDSVQES
jgi:hypothetical protein